MSEANILNVPNARRIGALVVMSMCLVPARARAQVAPPPPEDDQSRPRIRVRGLSVNPTVALSNIGVDSNVFNTVVDPKPDFTGTLSPALDAWVRAGRARLAVRGRNDLVYFQKYSSERSVDGGFGARLEVPLNRLTPWAEGGSYSGRQRAGYEIDLRTRRNVNDVGFGLDYRVGDKTSVGFGLHRNETSWNGDAVFFGNSLKQYLDRRGDSATLSYRQDLTVLTTFVVETSAARDRFDFSPERDTDSMRGTVGFDLKTRALIDGSARVGFRRFDVVGGGSESFKGAVVRADLGYVVRGVARLSVQTERDTNYSYERDYPYYVQTGVIGTVTQRVANSWDAQARVGRQNLAYRTLVGSTTATVGRTDKVDQFGVGIGYHLNPTVRVGFNVDKYRRSSPVQRRDYAAYRVGASVTYAQ